jgi:cytochrome c oxidase accessory protein FixG
VATGGAWIFYFADAPTLARDFLNGDAAYVAYASVGILTATTFVLGGFMREQVCIYMCPWPRIQTAMMDEKSLTVTYKDWRGEPRGKGIKRASLTDLGLGDCIDCNQCVAVCPTGIDIRNGPQIGCITCALCIDACDKVMAQVGRPRGLIDYATLEDCKTEAAGEAPKPVLRTILRPRTIIYFSVWAGIGLAMLFALEGRERISVSAQQQRNPTYVRLSDGQIRNSFTVKVRNMQARPRGFEISADGLPGAILWSDGGSRETASASVRTTIAPDSLGKVRMFVVAPFGAEVRDDFTFIATALDAEGGTATTKAIFERPE